MQDDRICLTFGRYVLNLRPLTPNVTLKWWENPMEEFSADGNVWRSNWISLGRHVPNKAENLPQRDGAIEDRSHYLDLIRTITEF